MSAFEDLEERLAEETGRLDPEAEEPALVMAAAVAVYLAHRRDEVSADRAELLRLAARAEFDGRPPEHVAAWLEGEGVSV